MMKIRGAASAVVVGVSVLMLAGCASLSEALAEGSPPSQVTAERSETPKATIAPAETEAPKETEAPAETKAPAETEAPVEVKAPEETKAPEAAQPEVPREHSAALQSARNYLDFMAFSKAGLFDQLTSEYGDQFPAEAAQYAVDNVGADWNEQALRSANEYLAFMPMSNAELHDQLTSAYGEQFTTEQADYAIANLP